jgi:hypothetical protein
MTLLLVTQPRFEHDPVPRADLLPGDARPGDVLTLAGGLLVRDANANGLADAYDASGRARRRAPIGRRVDVLV